MKALLEIEEQNREKLEETIRLVEQWSGRTEETKRRRSSGKNSKASGTSRPHPHRRQGRAHADPAKTEEGRSESRVFLIALKKLETAAVFQNCSESIAIIC